MEVAFKAFAGFLVITALVVVTAGINATIVWWLWPHAIPAIVPQLVKLGYMPAALSWAQSFALCWLSSILFSKVIYSSSK